MENKVQIVGKFEYNGETFIISIINQKRIEVFKRSDKKFSTNFTEKENQLIEKVLNKISINEKKAIQIEEKEVSGEKYFIYYDKESKNYFWKSLQGAENKEVNRILNFIYNHVPTVVCIAYNDKAEDNKGKNKYYTKLVKFGKKVIPIFLVATMSLGTLSACSDKEDKGIKMTLVQNGTTASEQVQEEAEEETEEREYSYVIYNYNQVKEAIEANPNLSEEEKEFLYKLQFVFDDYYQYMNYGMVLDRLENLSIEYDEEKVERVGGFYDTVENKITMNNATQFADVDLREFVHEFMHVLQDDNSNDYIMELSDELFTREVIKRLYEENLINKNVVYDSNVENYTNFGIGYNEDIFLYYVLAEIVSTDDLRSYQFHCDTDIFVKNLCKDDSVEEEEKVYKLLSKMNELRNVTEDGYLLPNNNKEKRNQCIELLNNYYKEINGIDIKEDFSLIVNEYGGGMYNSDHTTYNAIQKTLAGIFPNKNLDANIAIIPKNYVEGGYENTKVVFNLPEHPTIEITEELCNEYLENIALYKKGDYER